MSLRTSFPQGRCLGLTMHRNKIHQQYLMRGDSQQPKSPYFMTKLEKDVMSRKDLTKQTQPRKSSPPLHFS